MYWSLVHSLYICELQATTDPVSETISFLF